MPIGHIYERGKESNIIWEALAIRVGSDRSFERSQVSSRTLFGFVNLDLCMGLIALL
jgi:hypothetical protein